MTAKLNNVCVRFECGKEDRMGEKLGPFHYVQMTYEEMRVADDTDDNADRVLATIVDGDWIAEDGQSWSDVVIFNADAED